MSQCKNGNVFDRVPDGFKNLCNMKKLLMSRMKFENNSRLGKVHFKTVGTIFHYQLLILSSSFNFFFNRHVASLSFLPIASALQLLH